MQRIVVGISGASGVVYGVRALEMLRALDIETHLVMSKSAELTIHYERRFTQFVTSVHRLPVDHLKVLVC